MARTQCAVAIAFAALRKPDGSFALATFPNPTETPWTLEAIDELVRQTWADPHLSGGRVLVRSGRVPGAVWPGQNDQTKLAIAPLSDLVSADRPWGLLCVAGPTTGQFEQEQLDLLGTMAVRLTAYLRARQEVIENVFTVVGSGSDDEVGGQEDVLSWSPPPVRRAAPPPPPPAAPTPGASAPKLTPVPSEPTTPPRPVTASEPPAPPEPVVDSEPLFRVVSEEPLAPRGVPEPPARPVPAREEKLFKLAASFPAVEWYRGGETVPLTGVPGRTTVETVDEAGGVLGSILRPDPLTGLAGLPSVLVHLGTAMGTLGGMKAGSVAVVLVDITDPARALASGSDTVFSSIGERLRGHVRHEDLVGRIGYGTFAVVATGRQGDQDGPAIERRLVDATKQVLAAAPGASVRSAIASTTGEARTAAEDLLRDAISRLAAS